MCNNRKQEILPLHEVNLQIFMCCFMSVFSCVDTMAPTTSQIFCFQLPFPQVFIRAEVLQMFVEWNPELIFLVHSG